MQQPESILIVIENKGHLSRHQKETISVGCNLARRYVMLAVFGQPEQSMIDELVNYPIDIIWTSQHLLLGKYNADCYSQTIKQLIDHCSAQMLLMPYSYQVRDYSPKLAAIYRQSVISDCVGYRIDNQELIFQRQLFQGRLLTDISSEDLPLTMVSIQAGCFDINIDAHGKQAEIKTFEPVLSGEIIRTIESKPFKESENTIDLSHSDIIIAIGRGIKSADNMAMFNRLAMLLGAELAATRPVCDEGWLSYDRQIGTSGQSVSPRIYIAIGISGAIQHIIGMRSSNTIVAINNDKNAPIFQYSDIGIVADCFEIVPALIKQLENP